MLYSVAMLRRSVCTRICQSRAAQSAWLQQILLKRKIRHELFFKCCGLDHVEAFWQFGILLRTSCKKLSYRMHFCIRSHLIGCTFVWNENWLDVIFCPWFCAVMMILPWTSIVTNMSWPFDDEHYLLRSQLISLEAYGLLMWPLMEQGLNSLQASLSHGF